jgi:hypothetical protein
MHIATSGPSFELTALLKIGCRERKVIQGRRTLRGLLPALVLSQEAQVRCVLETMSRVNERPNVQPKKPIPGLRVVQMYHPVYKSYIDRSGLVSNSVQDHSTLELI